MHFGGVEYGVKNIVDIKVRGIGRCVELYQIIPMTKLSSIV
jgi:predicted metal-dependent phosphotriesterase family hydrolase